MGDPFRQLAETPTAAALAKLEAAPIHPVRWAAAQLAAYREVESAEAPTTLTASATEAKMRYLGAAAEGTFGNFKKQIFVDVAGSTQAHLSTRGYFFATYFASGKCILTFDHPAATPSSDVLRVRTGSSAFFRDYQAHGIAVADWVNEGETVIDVPDLQTALRLGRLYYRSIVPLRSAVSLVVTNPLFLGALFVILYVVLRYF